MKFIHIADLHLGLLTDPGHSWSRTWTDDRFSLLKTVVDTCNKEQTDLLLIAGDLFDRTPDAGMLRVVNDLFSTLQRTYVVLIAGNHDPVTADSAWQNFTWCRQVVFFKNPTFSSAYFSHLDTEVCGFSYDREEITESRYDSVRPGNRGKFQILLAHGGDDHHVPMHRQQIAQAGFSYVAMGHNHKPQTFPDQKMAYSGSLMPTGLTDTGKRGYIKGEITEKGTVFSFVPVSPHEYTTLQLNLTPDITQTEMEERLKERFQKTPGTVYHLILKGTYAPDSPVDEDRLMNCGDIVRLDNECVPDYSLQELEKEHSNDAIGMYLHLFDPEPTDETEKKALYFGLDALLKGTQL